MYLRANPVPVQKCRRPSFPLKQAPANQVESRTHCIASNLVLELRGYFIFLVGSTLYFSCIEPKFPARGYLEMSIKCKCLIFYGTRKFITIYNMYYFSRYTFKDDLYTNTYMCNLKYIHSHGNVFTRDMYTNRRKVQMKMYPGSIP